MCDFKCGTLMTIIISIEEPGITFGVGVYSDSLLVVVADESH